MPTATKGVKVKFTVEVNLMKDSDGITGKRSARGPHLPQQPDGVQALR